MRLQGYLLEVSQDYAEPRSKELECEDDAIAMIVAKCGKSLDRWLSQGGAYIERYVGDMYGMCRLTDPTKGVPRVSRNTENYMTLVMDNASSWKGWPLRSRSVIATATPASRAVSHVTFHVFPFDGVKMGVCPESDVWPSFEKTLGGGVQMWNSVLLMMFNEHKIKGVGGSWKGFVKALYKLRELRASPEFSEMDYKKLVRGWISRMLDDDEKIEKILSRELSPVKNKFKMVSAGDRLPSYSNEVWVGGKCVLVKGQNVLAKLEEL
jgi:hypothetical protein